MTTRTRSQAAQQQQLVLVNSDDEFEEQGETPYRPYNRGNKLKRSIPQPSYVSEYPGLWAASKIDEHTFVANVGKKRAIMSKSTRKPVVLTELEELSDEEFMEKTKVDETLDPYHRVDLTGFKVTNTIEEFSKNTALSQSLVSTRALTKLSNSAMDLIEQESRFVRCIGRLADVLFGDDPEFQDVEFVDKKKTVGVVDDESGNEMKVDGGSGFGGGEDEGEMSLAELASIREIVQENINCYNEVISKLSSTRGKILKVAAQKKAVALRLVPERCGIPPQAKKKGGNNHNTLNKTEQFLSPAECGLKEALDAKSDEDFSDRLW